jgi:hypothetical protein
LTGRRYRTWGSLLINLIVKAQIIIMQGMKRFSLYFTLIGISVLVFVFGFINRTIFLISFVSVFFGSLMSEFRGFGVNKIDPRFSIFFSLIIIMISVIAIMYTVFVEIFIGAVVGFFLARLFKDVRKIWFK